MVSSDPLYLFVNGKRRTVRPSYDMEAQGYRRTLSGKQGVLIMLDIAPEQNKTKWYGFERTAAQARELAASLIAMADELEAMEAAPNE